jgi:hypothetical protein
MCLHDIYQLSTLNGPLSFAGRSDNYIVPHSALSFTNYWFPRAIRLSFLIHRQITSKSYTSTGSTAELHGERCTCTYALKNSRMMRRLTILAEYNISSCRGSTSIWFRTFSSREISAARIMSIIIIWLGIVRPNGRLRGIRSGPLQGLGESRRSRRRIGSEWRMSGIIGGPFCTVLGLPFSLFLSFVDCWFAPLSSSISEHLDAQ